MQDAIQDVAQEATSQNRAAKHHANSPAKGIKYRSTVNGGASTLCYEMVATMPYLTCLREVG